MIAGAASVIYLRADGRAGGVISLSRCALRVPKITTRITAVDYFTTSFSLVWRTYYCVCCACHADFVSVRPRAAAPAVKKKKMALIHHINDALFCCGKHALQRRTDIMDCYRAASSSSSDIDTIHHQHQPTNLNCGLGGGR